MGVWSTLMVVVAVGSFMFVRNNGTRLSRDKYIATVDEGHDAHSVARAIDRHGAGGSAWDGSVERTHAALGVVIVKGPEGTCAVLQRVKGVKECEKDSILSLN